MTNIKNGKLPVFLWFILPLIAGILELLRDSIGNYKIFTGVFHHTLAQTNLYIEYPQEYFDTNHYGPLFSLVIAPFALLPKVAGLCLWNVFNAFVLFTAVRQLKISPVKQYLLLLVCCVELMTSAHQVQFNPSVAGLIILSFTLVDDEKDIWAALCIAIGFFVKIYGLAGLVFFCFSKHKIKFVVSFAFWCIVLFLLPMAISSPKFIIQSYADWYNSLVHKNAQNTSNDFFNFQNISVMGMIHRIFNYPLLNSLYVMVPAAVLYALPLLRFNQYKNYGFQLSILASTLLFIVLYSSGSESPTFIIALMGAATWFFSKGTYTKTDLALLWFAIIFTSLSATDLFPRYVRHNFFLRYAFKAFPCFLVWVKLTWELFTSNFADDPNILAEKK